MFYDSCFYAGIAVIFIQIMQKVIMIFFKTMGTKFFRNVIFYEQIVIFFGIESDFLDKIQKTML